MDLLAGEADRREGKAINIRVKLTNPIGWPTPNSESVMAEESKPRRVEYSSRMQYKQALNKWHKEWIKRRNAAKKAKKDKAA
jgi:hypothetical protein